VVKDPLVQLLSEIILDWTTSFLSDAPLWDAFGEHVKGNVTIRNDLCEKSFSMTNVCVEITPSDPE
jgi:hypothetical protein